MLLLPSLITLVILRHLTIRLLITCQKLEINGWELTDVTALLFYSNELLSRKNKYFLSSLFFWAAIWEIRIYCYFLYL